MLRFYAASFTAATGALHRAFGSISMANYAGLPEDVSSDREAVKGAINEAEKSIKELPLSPVVKGQFERIQQRIEHASSEELLILIRELLNNLTQDLTTPYFLMIPSQRRKLYQQDCGPIFGEEVEKIFSRAAVDAAAAGRCLALDEWTACVFHLMRVAEHGLRYMAEKVELPSDAMALENWKNVIDQIEKKIREMEQLPKSSDKSRRIKELSGCAVQFRYFKDAWRNHVAHAHVTYDERQALAIYTHTRDFMCDLAILS